MLKQLNKSFFPFMILLVGIIIGVIYLDYYASVLTEDNVVIRINGLSEQEVENILQFEEANTITNTSQLLEDSIYIEATQLYSHKKYSQAEELFTSLLIRYPKQIVLHNYLGLLDLKNKFFTKARNHFLNSVSIDENYYATWINLGIIYTNLHNYRDGISAYEKAIELHPNNPKSYFNLGLLYSKGAEWEHAIRLFDESIDKSSGKLKAKGLCYKGIALFENGDKESAKTVLQRAIEYHPSYELARVHHALCFEQRKDQEQGLLKLESLNPRSYYAHYHLGLFYKEEKELSKAEKHLKLALEINPNDEKIIEELSSFLITNAHIEEAELLVTGLQVNDTLPQTYFYQGRVAARREDFKEALLNYDLAISKSNNSYPEAHLNKAIIYKKLKKNKKAINSYKAAISYKVDYPKAYYNLALLYADKGQLKTAIKYNKLAIKYDSSSYKSWYNLGDLYVEQHKLLSATKAYQSSLKIKSDYLKGLASLGNVLTKRKKSDQAIIAFKNLLNQYPNYSKGWYNLGLLMRKENRFEEAIEAYEKVITLDLTNSKARMNLGILYDKIGKPKLAVKTLEDAADNAADDPTIRYNLALQYEKMGKNKKAIHQYNKTLQLNSKHERSIDKLIALHHAFGDSVKKHIAVYHKLKLHPDEAKLFALGKKLINEHSPAYALKTFKLTKKQGRKDHWIDYWIGKSYMDLSQNEKAIVYLKKAHEKNTTHKFTLYRLGQVYELEGKMKQSSNYYKVLLAIDPTFKIKHLTNKQLL